MLVTVRSVPSSAPYDFRDGFSFFNSGPYQKTALGNVYLQYLWKLGQDFQRHELTASSETHHCWMADSQAVGSLSLFLSATSYNEFVRGKVRDYGFLLGLGC